MKHISLLAVVLLMSGCAVPQWSQSGKTQSDFDQDRFACEGEAYQYASNMGATGNPLIVIDRFKACMKMKGYRQS